MEAFIGREDELAALRRAVDTAAQGRGRCVFLLGDPGMGKTRTAEELAVMARERGAQVLWGRCYEGEGAPPFWPWVQLIRTAVRALDDESLRAALGSGAPDLLRIVPELSDRLPGVTAPSDLAAAQVRFRVFESIERFLDRMAARSPLVLILDDLHGADESSLLLLRFVVGQLREMRILLLGTSREEESREQAPLRDTIVEALRESGTERIILGGLCEADLARFVEIGSGRRPTPELVKALHQRTEGNPFFAGEIVRAMIADGSSAAADVAPDRLLPETVKAVVARRLAPLSDDCREVLAIASVIGRDFSLSLLKQVVDDPLLIRRLGDALDSSVAANVLTRRDEGGVRFRFAHALIVDTLYEDLKASRRAELHQRVGRALEPFAEHHLAELAHHFSAAAGGGNLDKAADYARRAGDHALSLLAYEEAARLYALALRVLQEKRPVSVEDDDERCELLLDLATAQRRGGQRVRARETERRAADLARRLNRPHSLARAAVGDGHEGFVAGVKDAALVGLLEEALEALGEEDSIWRVKVAAQLAQALAADDSSGERRSAALSAEAVEVARRLGSPAALAEALLARHWVLGASTDIEMRSAVSGEALRAAAAAGDPLLVMACRETRVRDLLEIGDMNALACEIEKQVRDAEQIRQPVWLGQSAHLQAVRALLAGRVDEAEELALRGFSFGQQLNPEGGLQLFATQQVLIRREQGRLDEIEPAVRAQADQYPTAPAFRCGLAFVLAECRREVEARIEFERLATDDFAVLRQGAAAPNVSFATLADVCAFLGDEERARILYDLLLPLADRNIVLPFTFITVGSADYYLGRLASTMRRWGEACAHYEAAVGMGNRMGAPILRARAQVEWAGTLFARGEAGDADRGRALLEQATRTAASLGLRAVERRAVEVCSYAPAARSQSADPSRGVSSESHPVPEKFSRRDDEQRQVTERLSPSHAVFRREGDYWVIARGGEVLRLKHSKGLSYISYLLCRPGELVHVLELVSEGTTPEAALARATGDGPAAGLDRRARAEYKQRFADLRAELDDAECNHDLGRIDSLTAEMEILRDQLAATIGLGGRDRPGNAAAERARSATRKRIHDAIRRIQEDSAYLGDHLARSIRTGVFCVYLPPADSSLEWEM